MSLAPSDHLKQLNEIKKKFQEIVRSAEVVIDLNNKNFESSLKTNIANIKLIKTRIEFSLISYKIVAGLNACSDTLNKTSAGMKRSIETLKKIDSSQHPLAIIPKPATQIPKKHSTLHGVPDPERIEKTTTPKQIGPTGIVPRSPDLTSKIPDDPKNDPA